MNSNGFDSHLIWDQAHNHRKVSVQDLGGRATALQSSLSTSRYPILGRELKVCCWRNCRSGVGLWVNGDLVAGLVAGQGLSPRLMRGSLYSWWLSNQRRYVFTVCGFGIVSEAANLTSWRQNVTFRWQGSQISHLRQTYTPALIFA